MLKKTFLYWVVVGVTCLGVQQKIQAQSTATVLSFPNTSVNEHEFGYSSVEFAGYSVFGTEFNRTINVFKNNKFLFQTEGVVNSFGRALAMNRNWLAVGTPQDGNTKSEFSSIEKTGSVYLSKCINGVPQNSFLQKLTAANPRKDDRYGDALDIDGSWMVVGGGTDFFSTNGFIEIWKQTSTGWERKHTITPTVKSAVFGKSVAIKGDYMVVGAPGERKVYVYKKSNEIWSLLTTYSPELTTWGKPIYFPDRNGNLVLHGYESNFGFDVDITSGAIIVGDPNADKAAILAIQGSQLVRTHTLVAPPEPDRGDFGGQFGYSVAIQYNRALVGAPFAGNAPSTTSPGSFVTQGRVHMYTDGYQYKGYMRVGNPSGLIVKGLGRSVAIDEDQVLAGAEYTDNLNNRLNEGTAFRMPFWFVFQSGRVGMPETPASLATGALYPNPATEDQVSVSLADEAVRSVKAIALNGSVFDLCIQKNKVDIRSLKAGLYVIKIESDKGVSTSRFIKQ